jgi:hypothetical protein
MAIKNGLDITISQETLEDVQNSLSKSKEIYEGMTSEVKQNLTKSIAKNLGIPEELIAKDISKFVDDAFKVEETKEKLENFQRAFSAASKTDLGRYVFDAEKANNALGLLFLTDDNKKAWEKEIHEKWNNAVKNLSSKEAREAIASKISIGDYMNYMKGEQNLIVIIGNSVLQGTYNIISKEIDEKWNEIVDARTKELHKLGLLNKEEVAKIKEKLHSNLSGFDLSAQRIDNFGQTIGNNIYDVVDYFGTGKADKAVNDALDRLLNSSKSNYEKAKNAVLDFLNIKGEKVIVSKIDNRSKIEPVCNTSVSYLMSIKEKTSNLTLKR